MIISAPQLLIPTWKKHLRSLIRLVKTNKVAPSVETTAGGGRGYRRGLKSTNEETH